MSANLLCLARHSRGSFIRSLIVAILALAPNSLARAQQPDFNAVAAQAAHAVEKFKSDSVVVLDFVGPDTYVSELGRDLADQFSASLARAGGKFAVIDRAKMRQALESNRLAPEIATDQEIDAWLAQSVGAESAVFGRLSLDGTSLQLAIDCLRVRDGIVSGSFRAAYPLTDEWKALLANNVDPDFGVTAAGKSKMPSCKTCPAPQYTKAAIDARYNGTVVISVVIGKDGQARDFRVTKGLLYGLTVAAVQTVQNWTFDPAKGPDGEPGDMRVPIEITFRLGR